jgi:hypothetical protein
MLKHLSFSTLRQLPRVLVLSWVALWIIVFPLIHVHPEADHAHGGSHHQHGGLAHSVLSQDLPCEFGNDQHYTSHKETHLVGFPSHTHGHSHALSHSEITFSALNPSSDGPLKKQFIESFGTIDPNSSFSYDLAWGKVLPQKNTCSSQHFINPYSSRPPPVLLI